jgi:hypothetical protein
MGLSYPVTLSQKSKSKSPIYLRQSTVKPDESSGPDEMDQLNYSFEISEANTTTPRPFQVPAGQLYAPIKVALQSGKRFFYTDISDASANAYYRKEYPGLNLDFAPAMAPAFFSGKHMFNPVSKTIPTTHVLTPGLPLVQRQDFTFRERKSIPVSYSRSFPMNSFSNLKVSPGWGEVNNWRLFPHVCTSNLDLRPLKRSISFDHSRE